MNDVKVTDLELPKRELTPLLEKAEHIIKAMQDYIKFLGEAEKSTIGMLYAHGWSFPPALIKEGEEHRIKIGELWKEYIQ